MPSKVEHMNISVGNLEKTIQFLKTAMPDFYIRGEGDSESNNRPYHWVHLGTGESYVALQAFTGKNTSSTVRYSDVGGNHIGFEVENMEALIQRMEQIGYSPSSDRSEHPQRKRVYFETSDGLEWEFIEYLNDNLQLRNDYTI